MSVLVDTSALFALLDEDDPNHGPAVRMWHELLDDEVLLTHTYVVVESSALVQRRLGMDAVDRLHRVLLPAVDVRPVDPSTHQRAVEQWLAAHTRGLSLVDVTSFVVMAERGLHRAFAYDADFTRAGFTTV